MSTDSARIGARTTLAVALGAALAALAGAPAANAQQLQTSTGEVRSTGNPLRDTMLKMQRPVTINLNETRLQDVMKFLTEVTGADIEPLWKTDLEDGLDPEMLITMNVRGAAALTMLERVLERASTEWGANSWQMTPYGALEVGPKARLNNSKRVEMYDINDLLFVLPVFNNSPQIDLQQVLQQGQQGGGGGGQSPFQQNDQNQEIEAIPKEERAREIIEILTTLVESEQWQENGGEGGSIRYYQGHLIVNAADYLHRQIAGYPWWPSATARTTGGRRYVSLNMDAGNSQLIDLQNVPVTGVVPGGNGGGGNGGGGGRPGGGG